MGSTNNWTVVLTSDGEFIKIPFQPDHREGIEITVLSSGLEQSERQRQKRGRLLLRGTAIIAACLLVFLTAIPFFGQSQSYAAVTIEINPSVELSVDKEGKVIQVDSLTEAGEKLLSEIAWKNKTLPVVTLNIIQQAQLMGYLSERRRVLITTTYLRDERPENIRQMLAENVSLDQELTVVLIEGDAKYREEAREKQISLGLLMLARAMGEEMVQWSDISASDWEAKILPAVQGIEVLRFHREKDQTIEQQPNSQLNEVEKANGVPLLSEGQKKNRWVEQTKAEMRPNEERRANNHFSQRTRNVPIAKKEVAKDQASSFKPAQLKPPFPAHRKESGSPSRTKETDSPEESKHAPFARLKDSKSLSQTKQNVSMSESKREPSARLNDPKTSARTKENVSKSEFKHAPSVHKKERGSSLGTKENAHPSRPKHSPPRGNESSSESRTKEKRPPERADRPSFSSPRLKEPPSSVRSKRGDSTKVKRESDAPVRGKERESKRGGQRIETD